MDILDLLQQDGHQVKRVSSTHGGEFAGPCPFCGGNDRFRVWPEKDRYWCRQCGKTGDSIQYLRDARGMTYMQACGALQIGRRVMSLTRQKRPTWTPRETRTPKGAWQEKASVFLTWTQKQLWSEQGADTRTWLNQDRGLSDKTIKRVGLGWNPKNLWRNRTTWGLEDNGKSSNERI